MVVGEGTIDFAEQFFDAAAQFAVKLRRGGAGNAVAAIDGDAHGPRQFDRADDAFKIGAADIVPVVAAAAGCEFVVDDALAQRLDRLARQRVTGEHHFQTVVLRRVVRTGDHYAGQRAEFVRGVVEHRGRHHPDIDDIDAAGLQPARQRCGELGAGVAAVAADDHGVAATRLRFAADSAADEFDAADGEGVADDAADVVGLEDCCRRMSRGFH